MAMQYAYNYAIIDIPTGMCIEVYSTSRNYDGTEGYIAIPEYSEDYLMKFYIDGAWYEDAEATIPWSPEN
jgi:hypothetical protein